MKERLKAQKRHVLPVHPGDCQRPCEGQAETGSQSSPAVAPPAWRPSRCPTHHGRVSVTKKKNYKMKILTVSLKKIIRSSKCAVSICVL